MQQEAVLKYCKYSDIIWCEDLNWDMSRQSQFLKILSNFVSKIGLEPIWKYHAIDYTHIHTDYKSVSTIDHFIMSPRLLSLVKECGVLHRGDNLSRHSTVYMRL